MDVLRLLQGLAVAAALAALGLTFHRRRPDAWRLAAWAALASVAVLLAGIGLGSRRLPLSNQHESLLVMAGFAAAAALIARGPLERARRPALCLLCALLAGAGLARCDLSPLMPALRSRWLLLHVMAAMSAYAALAIAGLAGGAAFLSGREEESASAVRSLVKAGFLLLSAAMMSGAVWAEAAWGAYWSWDPKESWSLITWLFYAALLHVPAGWRSRGAVLCRLSLAGAFLVLFTYLGVNLLLRGLHSYA